MNDPRLSPRLSAVADPRTRRRIVRRSMVLRLLPLLGAGIGAAAFAQLRPIDYTIPLSTLAAQVAKRFPYTHELAGRLVTLELLHPRVSLLPATDQIATALDLKLSAPALGVVSDGALSVDFGLRYEPSDRTIRMTRPELRNVRLDAVPPNYQSWLDRNAPRLVDVLLDDYVLHQVDERDLAMAAALGYEPGGFKVTPQGLKVTLKPTKPKR